MERKFYIESQDDDSIQIYTFKDNQKYIINENKTNDEMKVAIVGSRSINDQMFVEYLFRCFTYIFGKPTKIISGGARGVDSFAGEYAGKSKIELQIFRPNWAKYGRKAGFIRNEDIIKNCDICLAIWDGESNGTKHDLELCEQYKKDLVLFNVKESTQGTFYGFYYKQYNKEQEINFSAPVITQNKQIHNRWLPQPGIISV
jgi:hypothetical protein